MKLTRSTFETLCNALEKNGLKNGLSYEKYEANFKIECEVLGEDLPIELTVCVNPERMVVLLLSRLPFVIQEDKRLEAAIAISAINNRLVDGTFDFDVKSGHVFFRVTNSYLESLLGEDLFMYMIAVSCRTVDDYNDKLLMFSKGMLPLEKFIESI